jgi:hypothetical protein
LQAGTEWTDSWEWQHLYPMLQHQLPLLKSHVWNEHHEASYQMVLTEISQVSENTQYGVDCKW